MNEKKLCLPRWKKNIENEPEKESENTDDIISEDTNAVVEKMEAEINENDKADEPESVSTEVDKSMGLYPGVTRRAIDVLMTIILNLGSKTFTHAFQYIEKYKTVIEEFVHDEQDQVEMMHSLFGVWQEQQQMIVVITERLLDSELVQPRAIICWLFSNEMFGQINNFYVWEVIDTILTRASLEENSEWNKLQELEDSSNDNENLKLSAKQRYAQSRKVYMDLVTQSLAGIICRLNQYSTKESISSRFQLDLVELLVYYSSNPLSEKDPLLAINDETKTWLLGRVENLLLSVDLPHNFVLKQMDRFISRISAPDQLLEIYGVYRATVNQSA